MLRPPVFAWCIIALPLVVASLAPAARPAAAQEAPATWLGACQTTSPGRRYRWGAKTDPETPGDPSAINPTSVAEMVTWAPLPGDWRARAAGDAPRQDGLEQQFFELPGAVQRVGLEPDGDVHLEVADADDPTLPRVIVELPQGDDASVFCAARQALFGGMGVDPTGLRSGSAVWARAPRPNQRPLDPLAVDVVGKAFYDGEHCGTDGVAHNHGTLLADATCWELHPIVQLTVLGAGTPSSPGTSAPVPSVEPPGDTSGVPQPAPATGVIFTSVTGAAPGGTARVSVQTSPGASCTIAYVTPSGTTSRAQGLGPQIADADGVITWSWDIGPSTRPGIGSVTASCGGQSATSPIPIG